ncbi:MAG: monovalent cation/H+ antiporter subunit D family protein, partial [Deltaproteobacteria bacterium]|nr:monovalent cation/H+ antiporter subunit D family protein [Deltaproteobacteria bacterium]
MTPIESVNVLWPLLVTFLAPFGILVAGRNQNIREGVSIVSGAITAMLVLIFAPAVLSGHIYRYELFRILPGITVSFAVDGLGIIFAFIAPFLWVFATSYNIGYMRSLKEHAQTRYYFCFAIAIFGAVGVALAANVFTLYLFYEIISIF